MSGVAPGARLQALPGVAFNILRPEAVESLYMLWRVTGEPRSRDMGWRIFQAFGAHCRVRARQPRRRAALPVPGVTL